MTTDYTHGTEPDGISYRCFLEPPNYVVVVKHPDGRELREQWYWAWEPVFGPNVADVAQAEEVMERLIKQLRG